MKKSTKKKLTTILIILAMIGYIILLSSCGPSLEEINAKEKLREDSINNIENKDKPKPITNQTVYYNAADFGLVPGTVLRWAPEDNDDAQKFFDEGKIVYIHIIEPGGKIVVLPSSEYIWLNLYPNNVLK